MRLADLKLAPPWRSPRASQGVAALLGPVPADRLLTLFPRPANKAPGLIGPTNAAVARGADFHTGAAIFLELQIITSHYPVSETRGCFIDSTPLNWLPVPPGVALLPNGAGLALNGRPLVPVSEALVLDGEAPSSCQTETSESVFSLVVLSGCALLPRFGVTPRIASRREPANESDADADNYAIVMESGAAPTAGSVTLSQENIPATPPQFAAVAPILHCDVQVTVTDFGTTSSNGAAHAARR